MWMLKKPKNLEVHREYVLPVLPQNQRTPISTLLELSGSPMCGVFEMTFVLIVMAILGLLIGE